MYGAGIPDEHLKCMFVNTLCGTVQADLRKRTDILTLQAVIVFILGEIGTYNDDRLAKLQTSKMSKLLGSSSRTPVNPVLPTTAVTEAAMLAMRPNLESAIGQILAAMQAKTRSRERPGRDARRPSKSPTREGKANKSTLGKTDPMFNGCWHCGNTGHSRQQCRSFQKLLADYGGKIPTRYQGKMEQSKKAGVHAALPLLLPDEDDSGKEFTETSAWHQPPNSAQMRVCMVKDPLTLASSFLAFMDEADEEDDMHLALTQFVNTVVVGPKVPQKQRHKKDTVEPLSMREVKSIAEAMKSGKISVPELSTHVSSGVELKEVWALMDSGASAHTTNQPVHFPRIAIVPLEPGGVTTLVNAVGLEMLVNGIIPVRATTTDGEHMSLLFHDFNVNMPVIRIPMLCDDNYDVGFSKRGGKVLNLSTQTASRFVKRAGVYVMKMLVTKGVKTESARVGRPSAP